MSRTCTYFVTNASPWAYLGHAAFIEIAARHGLRIDYLPIPLLRLFPETGGLPAPRRHPVRQRYRLIELQRWSARRGIRLNIKPRFVPFDVTRLDRTVIAILQSGTDPDRFMRAAWAAIWSEDRDLANPDVIAEIAGRTGIAPECVATASAPETEAAYEANLQAALAAGVFGAPSYVLDGELFWGQDRLDLLNEALTSGRPPYRAE